MYSFRFMVFNWAILHLRKFCRVDMKVRRVFYSQRFFVIVSAYVAIQKYAD